MAELFVYVPSCLGHLFYFFPSNLFTEFSCHSAAFQGQHLSEWHRLLSNNDLYLRFDNCYFPVHSVTYKLVGTVLPLDRVVILAGFKFVEELETGSCCSQVMYPREVDFLVL